MDRMKRALSLLLCMVMVIGLMPVSAIAVTDSTLAASLNEAKSYIDGITLNNSSNDPATVVQNFKTHFTWDNEKRENSKSYLFDWSYYNGVVFEGLEYVYEVTGESAYKDYVLEYMSSLITSSGGWATCTNNTSKQAAGYNSTHGADCYKTASLLLDAYEMSGDSRYLTMAETLYADLDTAASKYSLPNAGNNYHHTWASASSPNLWLDGLYMILPFRAEYAKHIGDTEELDLIVSRMQWVSDNMYDSSKGLFYHAANSATSNSGTYWLRSIGWYAAAIVDIMDSMEGDNLEAMKAQLKKLVDGMKAVQNSSNGMWLNNLNASQSSTNPYETSGTALVCYAVMKAVNNGWLDESYADMAILAFNGICNEKLSGSTLTDICFKGAPGSSNSTFYDNEGKGVGPFIMFYAEVLEYTQKEEEPEESIPETSEPAESEPVTYDELTDAATGVKVESGDITGLTVDVIPAEDVQALVADVLAGTLVAYDIVVENFNSGTADVTIDIPAGVNADKFAVFYLPDVGEPEQMPGSASADGKTYTFTTTHFSTYVGGELATAAEEPVEAVTGTGNLPGGTQYVLDTNGVDAGASYLIVSGNNGSASALRNNDGTKAGQSVTVSNNVATITSNESSSVWTFTASGSSWYISNGTQRIRLSNSDILNTSGQELTVSHQGNGAYQIYSGYYYLRYRNSSWQRYYSSGSVYLFKQETLSGATVTFTVAPGAAELWIGKTATLTPTITLSDGTTVRSSDIVWASDDTDVATVSNGVVTGKAAGSTTITATLNSVNGTALVDPIVLEIDVTVHDVSMTTWNVGSYSVLVGHEADFSDVTLEIVYTDGTTKTVTAGDIDFSYTDAAGEQTVTAIYKDTVTGKTLEHTFSITVTEKIVVDAVLDSYTGNVSRGSKQSADTGSRITVTYDDGTTEEIMVTPSMITKGTFDLTTEGTYKGLTVTFGGFTFPNYTLNVNPKAGNNYPEYPDAGAVDVNKYLADSKQFQNTGVANVELTTSGIPVQTGVDAVLTIDVSNSMSWKTGTKTYNDSNKLDEVMTAVKTFAGILLADNEDGTPTNNTMSIVIFGGYDSKYSTESYVDSTQTLVVRTSDASVVNSIADGTYFTSENNLRIAYQNENGGISNVSGSSRGDTNYDWAFQETNQVVDQIIAANGEDSEREIHVLFMSDGCPTNLGGVYYRTNSADTMTYPVTGQNYQTYSAWANENGITPELDSANGSKGAASDSAWMAAINTIIDENQGMPLAKTVYEKVTGMYGVGFDMAYGSFSGIGSWDEDTDWKSVFNGIISKLAGFDSNGNGFISVTDANDTDTLHAFYESLAREIRYAATNAYFVDQMGDNFDLKLGSYVTKFAGTEEEAVIALNPVPQITISSYNVYSRNDIGKTINGVEVTERMVGERYGSANVLETVVFNAEGTEAYSSSDGYTKGTKNVSGVAVTNYTGTNILNKTTKVIEADTFWYNTNNVAQMIDTDGDGVPDYSLAPETFYWKIGTINETEYVLNYAVYLEGAAEGRAVEGTYDTNEFANLYYNNWLGNSAVKFTTTPKLTWGGAQVSYGFYLVDPNGNPVTNQTTGATGSFYDAVKVTKAVLYKSVNLNSMETVDDIVAIASELLPDGYELFDGAATYTIAVDSGNSLSGWTISTEMDVHTTYVTNYSGHLASNELTVNEDSYDYSATTVWFAVKWVVGTVPDVVVIDYGIPVDIDVLENDMFGENGELIGVGSTENKPEPVGNEQYITEDSADFTSNFSAGNDGSLIYGDVQLVGDEVRYASISMEMPTYDKFSYEVAYSGGNSDGVQYFYGDVTVIPATIIYYEDNFLTYESFHVDTTDYSLTPYGADEVSLWQPVGEEVEGATQDEDRPGSYTFDNLDANNIYGYDSAYAAFSEYSLGSAMKATVDASTAAHASFTFYGTGFDIISLTDCDAGTIFVDVYDLDQPITENGVVTGYAEICNYVVDNYYGYVLNHYKQTYVYSATEGWTIKDQTACSEAEYEAGNKVIPTEPGTEAQEVIVYKRIYEIDTEANDNALYQVPVMKVEGLEYGHYKAVIRASYKSRMDHGQNDGSKSYNFILDAIRIYDPANDGKTDDTGLIEYAYTQDGEGWPVFTELRNHLLSAESFDNVSGDEITGAVFIDGNSSVDDEYIMSDYLNFGPNNEVYLAKDQAVAFKLDLSRFQKNGKSIVADVHMAVKTENGDAVQYQVYYLKDGVATDIRTYNLNTATDRYYKLPNYDKGVLVIQNTGAGLMSITNLKLTFTEDPYTSVAAEGEDLEIPVVISSEDANMAVMSLRMLSAEPEIPEETVPETTVPEETVPETTIPEETVPEETEPEIFEPDTFRINVNKTSVKTGQKVKVTVTTSRDVTYVIINGQKITNYSSSWWGSTRTWTLNVTTGEVGTMEIEAVAFNSDDVASEPISTTVTVKKTGGLFDWLW